MAKKSRFWSNFWGETGRNTGKWASNKIFGDTGWATPKRHILHNEGRRGNYAKGGASPSGSYDAQKDSLATELYLTEHFENIRELRQKASEISFDSGNTNQICNRLDELLTGARMAQQSNSSESIFTTKIRAGIVRLRRAGEYELANFYRSELNKVLLTKIGKKLVTLLLMILVFGGLIFFAFFL
jgi:hypothetical protein